MPETLDSTPFFPDALGRVFKPFYPPHAPLPLIPFRGRRVPLQGPHAPPFLRGGAWGPLWGTLRPLKGIRGRGAWGGSPGKADTP